MKNVLHSFFKLANLAIIFQLTTMPVVTPVASAQERNVDRDYSGTTNTAFQLASLFQQGANAFLNANNGPQNRFEQYRQQVSPMLALRPESPVSPTGQRNYPAVFDQCVVLSSTPNELGINARCENTSSQQILEGYAAAIIEVADDNLNALGVASADSNNRSDFRGKTCYQEQISSLATQLKAREIELENYIRSMEQIFQNFELASKETLEGIKQVDAILNGPCTNCREKDGSEPKDYLEDFRFENILFGADDNGACGSWYAENQVRRTGSEKGLKGIERDLTSTQITTADTFKGQRKQIRNEIMSLTSSIANTYQNRNGFNATGLNASNRTTLFSSTSPALAAAIGRFDTRINNQIEDLNTSLDMNNLLGSQRESTAQLSILYRQIQAGNVRDLDNIATQITLFERQTKAQCFSETVPRVLSSDSIGSALRKFENRNISGNKNRNADNAMANELANQIANLNNMDFDEFLDRVREIEMKGVNSLKQTTLGTTVDFGNGDTVSASVALRPSGVFERVAKNCEQQFSQRSADLGGTSLNTIVSRLRDYASQMSRLKQTANGNLLADLRRDLITCPGDTSTGAADMSCSASNLSPGGDNFCMATAQKCMANVYSCQNKMTAKIQEAQNQQNTLVANYQAEVETAKQQLLAEVTSLEAFMLQSARDLDRQLGVGTITETPGLQIDLVSGDFLREDVRGDLRLQDPEKYLAEIKKQITGEGGREEDSLLGKLRQQRRELVGEDGDNPNGSLAQKGRLGQMAQGYVTSYEENKSYYEDLIQECNQALARANREEDQRLEAINEQNEQVAEACNAVDQFNADPTQGDVGQIAGDLARASRIVAGLPNQGRPVNSYADREAIDQIRRFNQNCAESGGGYGSRNVSVGSICEVASLDNEPSNGTDREIWDLLNFDSPGTRNRTRRQCAATGYITRDIANDDGTNICRDGDEPFGRNSNICRLVTSRNEIRELGGSITYKRDENEIQGRPTTIVTESSCSSVENYTAVGTGEDGQPQILPLDFENFESNNPPNRQDIELAGEVSGRGTPRCIPGDEDDLRYDRREERRAEEDLENLAATFNCERATRSTGEVQISFCGSVNDSFFGIDPNIIGRGVQAAGQAARGF